MVSSTTCLPFLFIAAVVPVHVFSELFAALGESHETLRTPLGEVGKRHRVHSGRISQLHLIKISCDLPVDVECFKPHIQRKDHVFILVKLGSRGQLSRRDIGGARSGENARFVKVAEEVGKVLGQGGG
jgi:hypothetical protein